MEQQFEKLARKFGWLHPGLLVAGETAACVWGPSARAASDHTVTTWILLAVKDRGIPGGYLARLTMRRIAGGCGALYPDIVECGFLRTAASFQQGLHNAWRATLGEKLERVPDSIDFDVRWSLSLVNDTQILPDDSRIEGRSAEAAIACALRAVLENERLDPLVAITAMFQSPGSASHALTKVGSVDEKLLARFIASDEDRKDSLRQELRAAFHRKRIDTVLVSQDQPECHDANGRPGDRAVAGTGITLCPVETLEQAYRQLARFPRLTRHAKKHLADRAKRILEQQCDPYVLSSLSRPVIREPRDFAGPQEEREPLQSEEIMVVIGELPAHRNRVRLLAESGMGKSMLLVYCERQIAELHDDRLPLRLGAGPLPADNSRPGQPFPFLQLPLLSEIHWTGRPEDVLSDLASRLLHVVLPEHIGPEERSAWFAQLVRRGQVVFLLDAIDQTDGNPQGMASFLQSADMCRCPVLLTGRPETDRTRAASYRDTNWDTLWVDPFDEPRIRRFVGEELAQTLLPSENDRDAELTRKSQWADLLATPILLHEIRTLAANGELDGLVNRESVYAKAVEALLAKGFSTLAATEGDSTAFDCTADSLLEETAWYTIIQDATGSDREDQQFTGKIAGDAFKRFASDHYTRGNHKTLDALGQVNMTLLEAMFDRFGRVQYRSLAWRHLSFCEYFAGRHLAEMPSQARCETIQRHGRDVRWRWVFRFALSYAMRLSQAENPPMKQALVQLATDLIRFGNPFVVYDAIAEDHVDLAAIAPKVDRLCRWLVHRTYRTYQSECDYSRAWPAGQSPPEADDEVCDLLATLFAREYRDSRCLHPAWELLEANSGERARTIRDDFQAEFAQMLRAAVNQVQPRPCRGNMAWRQVPSFQLVPEQHLVDLGLLEIDELDHLPTHERNFIRCPPVELGIDGQPFWMGSPDDELGHGRDEKLRRVVVEPFLLQRTPVTNAQWELFDPSHRQFRGKYSQDDEQPVVYVNWFMAQMMCLWLGQCRLPDEAEWELACRAGTATPFGVGNGCKLTHQDANFGFKVGRTTPVASYPANKWGLRDMHGNVWEWCRDLYGSGSSRVLRGGSFGNNAVHCRSACRNDFEPHLDGRYNGFRLCRASSV